MLPLKNTRLNQVNQTHYKQFQKPIPVHFFTWRNCTEFSISILPYRSMRAITHPICCVCAMSVCTRVPVSTGACAWLPVPTQCSKHPQHLPHHRLCRLWRQRSNKTQWHSSEDSRMTFQRSLLLPTEYSTGNSSAQQWRQSCCARCCNTYALSTLHHLTLKILT